MMINRLAHYIKVLQRENIGSWKSQRRAPGRAQQAGSASMSPTRRTRPPDVRSRRPLRKARDPRRGRRGRAGLVSRRHGGGAALQVHGRRLHAVAQGQAGWTKKRGVTATGLHLHSGLAHDAPCLIGRCWSVSEAATGDAIPVREHGSISLYQDGVLQNIRRVLQCASGCCESRRPTTGCPTSTT